jgi:adenine-specific DNA-methyltransferase
MPTLNWIGKDRIINHHQEVPFRTLEKQYSFKQTEGDSSKIIQGDNLEALKALLPQYENRVKCIYIDPPYNTGNEGWVYNDNVNDPRLKIWLGQVVGKEAEDLSRHDKWLCMMYPRLKLLHKLLADDGAIFISIDDNEQANLRLIMDEIFGGGNFINNVIWQKKFSPQNDARYFSDMHDFIITYAKNKSSWNRNLAPRKEEQNARYKNVDNDKRGVWTSGDLSVKTYNANTDYPIITPSGRIVNPPAGYCWRFSREKFAELLTENRIWFGSDGGNVPRFKRFLTDVQDGTVPVTLWLRDEVGDNQEGKQELKKIFSDSSTPFETPKPVRLLEKILQISTNKNDIILDSFAGSGTTAHAVLNLNKADGGNREFILIEMNDYAETISAERVRRVIEGYGNTEGTGGSFDFYTLGESLFDEQGNLNAQAKIEAIREYIWFTETRSNFQVNHSSNNESQPSFLGRHNETDYYFCYDPNQAIILDMDLLGTITQKASQYLIYADSCELSEDFLNANNIIFKKIPRDITRL